jgi:hypothetical protein
MPRVIVITDSSPPPPDAAVLLDERVESVHLSTGHAAAQLVERLAWAISDAEEAEIAPRGRRGSNRGGRPARGRLIAPGTQRRPTDSARAARLAPVTGR